MFHGVGTMSADDHLQSEGVVEADLPVFGHDAYAAFADDYEQYEVWDGFA